MTLVFDELLNNSLDTARAGVMALYTGLLLLVWPMVTFDAWHGSNVSPRQLWGQLFALAI